MGVAERRNKAKFILKLEFQIVADLVLRARVLQLIWVGMLNIWPSHDLLYLRYQYKYDLNILRL